MEDVDYTFDGFFTWFICVLVYMGFVFGIMGGEFGMVKELYTFSTILIILITHTISFYVLFKERQT